MITSGQRNGLRATQNTAAQILARNRSRSHSARALGSSIDSIMLLVSGIGTGYFRQIAPLRRSSESASLGACRIIEFISERTCTYAGCDGSTRRSATSRKSARLSEITSCRKVASIVGRTINCSTPIMASAPKPNRMRRTTDSGFMTSPPLAKPPSLSSPLELLSGSIRSSSCAIAGPCFFSCFFLNRVLKIPGPRRGAGQQPRHPLVCSERDQQREYCVCFLPCQALHG